jgi:hypothetical protein
LDAGNLSSETLELKMVAQIKKANKCLVLCIFRLEYINAIDEDFDHLYVAYTLQQKSFWQDKIPSGQHNVGTQRNHTKGA